MVIRNIIEQHSQEAAFLWLLRQKIAITAPHYSLQDIAELEERIEAHISGLRIAGDVGWEVCEQDLSIEQAGEIFVAAVLAFEANDKQKIEKVISLVDKNPDFITPLVSALSWVDIKIAKPHYLNLQKSKNAQYQRVGLMASVLFGSDPGQLLSSWLEDSDPQLRIAALRAAGELKRQDLLSFILKQLDDEDESIQFWAARSAVLLSGNVDAVKKLAAYVKPGSAYTEEVFQLLLRIMNGVKAQDWLKAFVKQEGLLRQVLIGTGITGDPIYIPTLLHHMKIPEFARVAGEAFNLITGLDIEGQGLTMEMPKNFQGGPNENPQDENVDMDPDENLPWPDPAKIQNVWNDNQNLFQSGARYLLGKPISQNHCMEVLKTGLQRQRKAASLELALMQPSTPLFQITLPAAKQNILLQLG